MSRFTELGYPVLKSNLHSRIFGAIEPKAMSRIQRQKAENLLSEFDIETPVNYPDHMYDGPLPLP